MHCLFCSTLFCRRRESSDSRRETTCTFPFYSSALHDYLQWGSISERTRFWYRRDGCVLPSNSQMHTKLYDSKFDGRCTFISLRWLVDGITIPFRVSIQYGITNETTIRYSNYCLHLNGEYLLIYSRPCSVKIEKEKECLWIISCLCSKRHGSDWIISSEQYVEERTVRDFLCNMQ